MLIRNKELKLSHEEIHLSLGRRQYICYQPRRDLAKNQIGCKSHCHSRKQLRRHCKQEFKLYNRLFLQDFMDKEQLLSMLITPELFQPDPTDGRLVLSPIREITNQANSKNLDFSSLRIQSKYKKLFITRKG